MKIISNNRIEKNHVHNFVVEPDLSAWRQACQKEINRAAKNINLKGYRKGHVPANVAIRYINPQLIYQNAFNQIGGVTYNQLIKDKSLQDLNIIEDSYSISISKISYNDIEIIFSFDIVPNVTIDNYKNIKGCQMPKIEVTEKEIDEVVNRFAAGKKADDEFAKSLKFNNVNNLEQLRKHFKQLLTWQKEEEAFIKVRNIITKELLKKIKLDYIPTKILDQQKNVFADPYLRAARQAKKSLEDFVKTEPSLGTMAKYNQLITNLAHDNVILSFGLDKIIEDNKLDLTDTDKNAFYEKYAMTRNCSIEQAKIALAGEKNEALMLHEKTFKALIEMNKNNKATETKEKQEEKTANNKSADKKEK